MATKQICITLPAELVTVVKKFAHLEEQTLSGWLRETVEWRIGHELDRIERNRRNVAQDHHNLHAEQAARIAELEAQLHQARAQ
jgi:hypothetical protein